MKFVKNERYIQKTLIKTVLFLICSVVTAQTSIAAEIKVGIMLSKINSVASTANTEKMCIIRGSATEIQRHHLNSHPHSDDSPTHTAIKFFFYENNRSVIGSVTAAKMMVEDGIDVALLPLLSKEAIPANDILQKNGVAVLTSATAHDVIKQPDLSRSIMPSNRFQAKILADLVLQEYSDRKIYTLTNISSKYSKEMTDLFRKEIFKNGINFEVESLSTIEYEFLDAIDKIEDGSVIFTPLYNPHIAIFYKALAQSGKTVTLLGPDSVGGRKEFFEIIGETTSNIQLYFLKNWDGEVKGPNSSEFLVHHKTYCDNPNPSFLNVYSYDLMRLLETTIHAALKYDELDSKHFTKYAEMSNYLSVMDGTGYMFDNYGYNQKSMYLYRTEGKRIVKVKQVP